MRGREDENIGGRREKVTGTEYEQQDKLDEEYRDTLCTIHEPIL